MRRSAVGAAPHWVEPSLSTHVRLAHLATNLIVPMNSGIGRLLHIIEV